MPYIDLPRIPTNNGAKWRSNVQEMYENIPLDLVLLLLFASSEVESGKGLIII